MIGVGIALVALVLALVLKGVSPVVLFNAPAILIVLVGTSGATISSFGLPMFLRLPKLAAIGLRAPAGDSRTMRDQLVTFAERARREGLLALESDIEEVGDTFVRRGLQMVIDGLEPETVDEVLQLEVEAMSRRHAQGATMLAAMAGYAPTFGILGAVMGLIAVMAHLSEPEKLGAGIQVAFIATLLAVGIANILFLPLSVSLKSHSAAEVSARRMAMAGILAIQAGDNPRMVARKVDAFLDPGVLSAARGEAQESESARTLAGLPQAGAS